jgi:hypothetical protein
MTVLIVVSRDATESRTRRCPLWIVTTPGHDQDVFVAHDLELVASSRCLSYIDLYELCFCRALS